MLAEMEAQNRLRLPLLMEWGSHPVQIKGPLCWSVLPVWVSLCMCSTKITQKNYSERTKQHRDTTSVRSEHHPHMSYWFMKGPRLKTRRICELTLHLLWQIHLATLPFRQTFLHPVCDGPITTVYLIWGRFDMIWQIEECHRSRFEKSHVSQLWLVVGLSS